MPILKAVSSAKPGQAATLEVPQSVKDEIDEMYEHLRTHPGQEGFAEFGEDENVKLWMNQARTYCTTREAGALKFRQLPSKHLPATQIRFNITADVPANGERNGQAGPAPEAPKPTAPANKAAKK